jgi:hypothetical protein
MRNSFRLLLLAAAAMASGPGLRAGDGTFGAALGALVPTGGARRWLGATTGPAVDAMESFEVYRQDRLRMRMGFFYLKAPVDLSQTVTFPSIPAAVYPYSSSNELFGFTYGVDYLHSFGSRVYALGGLGFGYLTAAAKGSLDLSAQGSGVVQARYDANGLAPYACAGLGVDLGAHLALEARYQASSVRAQQRVLRMGKGGPEGGVASFPRVDVGALSFGLVASF